MQRIKGAVVLFLWNKEKGGREGSLQITAMAEKPEDLNLPASVVARIIKDAEINYSKSLN